MSANWDWESFWKSLGQMSEPIQMDAARQLDLERWLATRSVKVQSEVLLSAPESVVTFLFLKKIINADTIGKLVKAGKNVTIPETSKTKVSVSKSGYKSLRRTKG